MEMLLTAIGIDIGGTNTRVAVVDRNLHVLHRIQFATDAVSPENTLQQLSEAIKDYADAEPCGIGMSCPGPLDTFSGKIIETPNLGRDWYGYPLTQKLEELTGLKVNLENDANLAALAEANAGEGKHYSHVQFITVSTGLGCGLVVDGKIYRGAHGLANEAANVILWQDGPSHGSIMPGGVEAICSGTGISSRAVKAGLPAHPGKVYEMARNGNTAALEIYAEAENYLANFIAGLYALNDPDIIILGGSVALKTPGFIDRVKLLTIEKLPAVFRPFVNIQKSTLSEDSGLIGAGLLAFQSNSKKSEKE